MLPIPFLAKEGTILEHVVAINYPRCAKWTDWQICSMMKLESGVWEEEMDDRKFQSRSLKESYFLHFLSFIPLSDTPVLNFIILHLHQLTCTLGWMSNWQVWLACMHFVSPVIFGKD